MILAFFAVLLLIGQYFLAKKEWEYTEIVRQFIMVISIIFLLHDTYYYIFVPAEMSSFYNSGAGIQVGNGTFFNSTDTRFEYYAGITKNDYVFIEMLTSMALFAMPLAGALYVLDWLGKNTMLMERVK